MCGKEGDQTNWQYGMEKFHSTSQCGTRIISHEVGRCFEYDFVRLVCYTIFLHRCSAIQNWVVPQKLQCKRDNMHYLFSMSWNTLLCGDKAIFSLSFVLSGLFQALRCADHPVEMC